MQRKRNAKEGKKIIEGLQMDSRYSWSKFRIKHPIPRVARHDTYKIECEDSMGDTTKNRIK